MSKKLICLVSFVLVLGLTSNAFAQPADGQIQQTLVAPVIDGLEEDIWWGVLAYPIDQVVVGSATSIQNELDFSATWKALWDSTRIYFLVDVTDDILIFDSPGEGAWPNMHYDDSVEVHLDADNSKGTTYATDDFQYGFRWDDPDTIGTGGNSNTDTTGVEFVILGKTNPKGYICEISIPWSTLGTTPGLGDFIGANVGVNDDDEGGEQEFQLTWLVTSGDQWMNPSLFPTMELVTALARGKSWNPNPTDGAMLADTWVNLSWSPGALAVSHDVYVGDNFDDVNAGAEGTFQGNQAETFIVVGFPGFPYPDGLVPGTTYYWRIDEINDTEPNSPWKGNVWSFSVPPKTAYAPDPADGAEMVDPDIMLSWTGGYGAKLHTVYFGDNFDEVNNAVGGLPQGTATYTPGTLKLAKTYYWRVDEFDAIETYKGDIWSFTTEGAVGSPDPANGAVDVKQTPVLTWSPGVYAVSHQIYFGTDKEAVRNADTSSPEYKGAGDLGSQSFDPGKLQWNTTYYWRIDEANNINPDSPWTGSLWSFTTANFLIVDDFESYNDLDPADPESNRIFNVWLDGYDDPTNGSLVGYENPPFAEQTIVHGGNQSIPLYYDNSVGYSEATLTLTYPRDWTENGVSTLTIWFRGDSANAAETLYVALNGSAVVNHDNPDAAQITAWTEWTIDLQAFGVNLANVNTISLGLGNKTNPQAGGSGTMYFDDIRLYPPAP
ncbi:MAG TPA: sugar-binding protein [Sedimentisphaerales bacterium]|nr:sugar-binding protein [Sedimentisphaerales bacterium]